MTTQSQKTTSVAFVGGGHMAAALIGGLRRQDSKKPIVVAEHNAEKRQNLEKQYSAITVPSAAELPPADILVLAVRPADMQSACLSLPAQSDAPAPYHAIVSVALGIPIKTIRGWLPFAVSNIARAMPNTPAAVGCGMTACYGELSADAKQQITALFDSCGKTAWLSAENLLDAATAVSGSSPAYFYYIAEAMTESAVAMGLPPQTAAELVAQTMAGSALMLSESDKTAADLRQAVAVPGGSTERAIQILQQENIKKIFAEAMEACRQRAEEIANTPK